MDIIIKGITTIKAWKQNSKKSHDLHRDEDLHVQSLCKPTKKLKLAYFIIGVGLELPYLALLTSVDLFQSLFGPAIEYELTLAFDPLCLLSCVLVVTGISCQPHGKTRCFLTVGFLSKTFLMITTILCLLYIENTAVNHVLIVTIMAFIALFCSLNHITSFEFGARHEAFTQKLMQGLSVSGALISLFRIGTKIIFPNTDEGMLQATFVYFEITILWCLACVVSAIYITSRDPSVAESKPLLPPTDTHVERESLITKRIIAVGSEEEIWLETSDRVRLRTHRHINLIMLTYFIAYSIFPGVLSNIQFQSEFLNQSGWTSVLLLSLFNFTNLAGSVLAEFWPALSLETMYRITYFKVLFGMYFIAMAYMSLNPQWPLWLDIINCCCVILWGVTTGYIGTLVSTMASEIVDPGPDRNTVGEYISFAFNVGIASGTVMAFIIAQVIFL